MSLSSARALLEAARSFIADIPPLALLNAPRRTGRMLVARIDRYLETAPRQDAPRDVIKETRERWRGEAGIRIDDDAMMRGDGRGIWISAWVLAGPAVQSFDRATFLQALNSLPVMEREVYVLHRVEGRTIDEIGERLFCPTEEAEALFFAALRGLHERIYGRKN
tara:strand:+ start:925 stop:1419 length:495 start_codon:yes stop_codon:yes gene_type:complete